MSGSMARLLVSLVFALGTFSIAKAKLHSAVSQTPGGTPMMNVRPWMKCVAIVQVTNNANASNPSAGPANPSGNLPTNSGARLSGSPLQIRIEFKQEPQNGEEISADTYLIQPNGQAIRQIGHAELLSAASDSAFALQQAPDSAATMSLTVVDSQNSSGGPNDGGASNSRAKEVSAQISNLTFFTGEQAAAASATCRIYAQPASASEPGQAPSPVPSPSAAASPLPSPTPGATAAN